MKDFIWGVFIIFVGVLGILAESWTEFYLYYKYDIEHKWMLFPFILTSIVVAIFFVVIIVIGIALVGTAIDEHTSKQKENEKIS